MGRKTDDKAKPPAGNPPAFSIGIAVFARKGHGHCLAGRIGARRIDARGTDGRSPPWLARHGARAGVEFPAPD
jgi:hypothetical protein